ncbi:MAG: hypothetical protein JWM10_1042 [Myxococcaceae bacterium]|nr:hypothetical protein [Myxococcaceae bacterium]
MTPSRAAGCAALALLVGCDLDLIELPSLPSLPTVPSRPSLPTVPSWPTVPALPSGRSVHLALGVPTDASSQDELVLVKPQYVVSYNRFRNDPNWVAWRLTAADLGTVGRTQRTFSPDPQLPDGVYRVHHRDYAGSGYDHGHLCPSAERTATFDDNAATFLTTNIVPQRHAINAGAWESLERWSVEKAREGWDLFIVAGGRWDPSCATDSSPLGAVPGDACPSVGRSPDPARRVAIPISTWKVIVLVPRGHGLDAVTAGTPVVAVEMPNEAGSGHDWERYAVSVDELEARTGYDFLNLVAGAVQQRIEAAAWRGGDVAR